MSFVTKSRSTFQVLEEIKAAKTDFEVFPTGFPAVDKDLDGGFFRKELVVIGAHTGVGKSQIAGQLMFNIASKGFRTAYFSLEISNAMVVSRLVGALANVKPTKVKIGTLEAIDVEPVIRSEAKLLALDDNLNFYDSMYDLTAISTEIRTGKYDLVVVDFIQNIMCPTYRDEYSRLSHISLTLQGLAKQCDCCIIVLSQLSNSAAKEGTGSRTVEYKGSGSIATVCDLGFFMERLNQGSDMKWSAQSEFQTTLTLRKNRRGISGYTYKIHFKNPGGMMYESR